MQDTPEEAAKRRATADLNDALEVLGSSIKSVHRVEYSRRNTQNRKLLGWKGLVDFLRVDQTG